MRKFLVLVLAFVAVFAVSCGDKKNGGAVKEKVSQEISADDGGTISTSDESVTMDIPAGALDSDTKITMTVYESSRYAVKKGEEVVTTVVECEPSGTVFKKPILIKMTNDTNIVNKLITAAVYDESKGAWSYSGSGKAVMIAGKDAAGDPIMTTAAGNPVSLNEAGDPIMTSAAGDPIMLASAGDPIMVTAAGDPIMNSAAGDPIMMTTGHFTAYTFIALGDDWEGPEKPDDTDDAGVDDADAADDKEPVDDEDKVPDEDENASVPECGNGILDESEDCDDGANNGKYGYCNEDCNGLAPRCGDDYLNEEYGEVCDDGALNGTYGYCNTTCSGLAAHCGDGNIDTANGEVCDNGADNGNTDCAYGETSCTVCAWNCQPEEGFVSYCGDGLVDEDHGEACDDAAENGRTKCDFNQTECTVCTSSCQIASGETSYCGDGRTDAENEEECDNGTDNGQILNCAYGETSCILCNGDCHTFEGAVSYCGDGKIDEAGGEACDKADPQVGDGYGTGNRCSDDCTVNCFEHATWNGTECVPDTMQAECEDLPDNADWNYTGTITQTWSGEEWLPSTTPFYSAEPGQTTDCSFKCKENYNWNADDEVCAAATQQAECSAPPANAERNTAVSITQTWSGEEWLPSATSVYNYDGSIEECFFKCKENYEWNENASECQLEAHCGDGILSGDEECDDGEDNGDYGYCKTDCSECTDDEFHIENGHCVSNAGEYTDCEGTLPDYAEWVNGEYYRYWINTGDLGSSSGYWYSPQMTYSEDEYTDCSFKCLEGFEWHEDDYECRCPQDRPLNTDDPDNPYCALTGNVQECSPKPEHSVWTDNGQHGMYVVSMTNQVTTHYGGGDNCDCCFDCEDVYWWYEADGKCHEME